MAARIALRIAQFHKYTQLKGWRTARQVAYAMDLDPATLSRVVRGHVAPGEKFIAAALATFPELEFGDLFEVLVESPAAPPPARQPQPGPGVRPGPRPGAPPGPRTVPPRFPPAR